MTPLVQILLSVVILTLTFCVAFAAIQIFHILHEFRHTLKKLNRIMDNTQTLSEASARPITAVNQFFTEVKSLVSETQDEIIASTPDRVIQPSIHSAKPSTTPRFFHRSGLPLRPS